MGKKSKTPPAPAAPAAPDYTAVAAAQSQSAEIAAQISREQLAWAKEQYYSDREVTQGVVERAIAMQERESAAAAQDRERYQSHFQPMEDDLVREAQSYNSLARQEQEAGRAMAAMGEQFNAARRGAIADLESYGIDPSQVRSGALDHGARIQEGAAMAGTANAARENVINTARALRSEAINIGRGYGSQIAQTYGTALQAGNQAVNSRLAQTQSGAQTMGTGAQWAGIQGNALDSWGRSVGMQGAAAQQGYNNALQRQQMKTQNSAGIWGGIGTLAGGVIGAFAGGPAGAMMGASLGGAAMGSASRSFAEGGRVTAIPQGTPGGSPQGGPAQAIPASMSPSGGVETDDVPIIANEGEIVVPEDVVRWKGQEFFDKLAMKSREAMGDPNPRGLGPDGGKAVPPRRRQAILERARA